VAWARGVHAARALGSAILPTWFSRPPAWGTPASCSTAVLRALNVPLAAAGFAAAVSVHRSLHPAAPPDVSTLTGLAVALLPTHAFFGWLFYTDVAGLTFLLAAWAASTRRRYGLAGLLATAATATRQTHAVWAAPLALAALVAEADASRPAGAPTIAAAAPRSAPRQAIALARAVAARPAATLGVIWPLALPQAALAALIVVNGGSVALGDKAAHAPGMHFAQVVYAAAFISAILALPFLSLRTAALAIQDAGGHTGALFIRGVLARTLAGWLAASDGAKKPHPYLLADNRHLTFYGWRAYKRTWPAGILGLAFTAAGLGWGWVAALLRAGAAGWGGGELWVAGLGVAAAAALVPAPLLEPRYFSPLAAIALLAAPPARPGRLVVTCVAFAGVGAALVWLFLERPFVGADGKVARFMW
jgi:alpha-1,2-glucosyltransferase